MELDPCTMSVRDLYQWMVTLITPRPIAWVSTVSQQGTANLAPYSFFNGVGANPPLVMFCPANQRDGAPKDTLANIQQTKQFVVNLVTESDAEKMNLTAANYAADEDEFQMAGIGKSRSHLVLPPRVTAAAVAFECELHTALNLGDGPGGANLVIGKILKIHVDDRLLDEAGELAVERLDTIGRMGGVQYVRTSDRFELPRPKRPTSDKL